MTEAWAAVAEVMTSLQTSEWVPMKINVQIIFSLSHFLIRESAPPDALFRANKMQFPNLWQRLRQNKLTCFALKTINGPFPASYIFTLVFSTVNNKYFHYVIFTDDWIRTADLCYWERPLCQLSHSHCTKMFSVPSQVHFTTFLLYWNACPTHGNVDLELDTLIVSKSCYHKINFRVA